MAAVATQKPLHIAILWRGDFPHGMALTNRFIAFAKGFIEHGQQVVFLCTVPASRTGAPANLQHHGVYQGIEYRYLTDALFMANSRLRRLGQRTIGFARALKEISSRKSKGQLDVIFSFEMPLMQSIILIGLCRVLGIKIVYERNEDPMLEAAGRPIAKLKKLVFLHGIVRWYHGVVVISKALESAYRPRLGRNAGLLVIPANSDSTRFTDYVHGSAVPVEGRYVAWCGSVWGNKDGVSDLVSAFDRIATAHPDVRLVLIAPTTGTLDYENIIRQIREAGLEHRVMMPGRVEREDMPGYLCNAEVLALARPESRQAEFGFPTKLPEYLATGRPVVVTRVGDIPRYIEHGKQAFLVTPGDIGRFAAELDSVLRDPVRARQVGAEGRRLAETVFSGQSQAVQLIRFFEALA